MANSEFWLIYALGGGWGHMNRAIALARAAHIPVEILVNSPYANLVKPQLTHSLITLHSLPDLTIPGSQTIRAKLAREVIRQLFNC